MSVSRVCLVLSSVTQLLTHDIDFGSGCANSQEYVPVSCICWYLPVLTGLLARTKQYSSRASFNKTEEMFVSNWQTARVKIVVHDAVPRGKDPVLGEVDVSIADFLSHGCQQTELRSLQNGIGYGRISM